MLIYDGDCGFCTHSAHWVAQRLDSDERVVAWQSLSLNDFGLTEHDVTTAAYWIDPDGNPKRGHLAVGRALEAIGGVYQPIGWLLQRPPVSWLARPSYRLVAKYRYRLPGSTDACRIT